MAASAATDVVTNSARELVIARVFDAPRELLFDAWTERRHLERWWGPHGFRTTTHEIDVRPGGVWRFTMHGPDGTDFGNTIVFLEIVRPERLVYRHSGEGPTADVRFDVTITFEAQGDKTLLTMRSIFESADAKQLVVDKYGAVEGGRQHLARLAEFVAALGSAS